MRKYRHLPQLEVPKMPVVYIGEGFLYGSLFLVEDFPGYCLDTSRSRRVYGEVYLLREQNRFFREMDEYELAVVKPGRETYYKRVIRPVHVSGKVYSCWVYEYIRPALHLPRIGSGRFEMRKN